MASEMPWLSIVTFTPLVGAFLILLLVRGSPEDVARNARWSALWTSGITFFISLFIWVNFDTSTHEFQFVENAPWMPEYRINYHMGVDGISMFFVLLSTLLTPICIGASWTAIQEKVKEYMVAFLVLETMMVGMFCALDFVAFYIFFEAVLIPMFLIIGIWGGPRRIYAAIKFYLYTLAGSVLFLIAIIIMGYTSGTFDIRELITYNFSYQLQLLLWPALFASFAVKTPMWPFHTWLPDAHVEAPTAGSVILAGVLLKVGGYGFIRFSIPMLPNASEFYAPLVFVLGVIAIIYASLVALMQTDMKKLIAYSSVAHMGYVTIGLFSFRQEGIDGAIIQMLSHGLVSAALFLCIGVLYDRMHTRMIADYGGIVTKMPKFALIFMIFTLASIGLPGTSGFVGEVLVLIAAYKVNGYLAFATGLGMVLGAAYMLWLYKRVVFGKLENINLNEISDLDKREFVIFIPIIIGVFWLGIYPESFSLEFRESVLNLINTFNNRIIN